MYILNGNINAFDTRGLCPQFVTICIYHDMINLHYWKYGRDTESFHKRNVNRGILGLLIFSYLGWSRTAESRQDFYSNSNNSVVQYHDSYCLETWKEKIKKSYSRINKKDIAVNYIYKHFLC